MKVRISDITIGDNRRTISSDKVSQLADSIKEIGLLNPITITIDNRLIAGYHRLKACELLGYEDIEANVVSIDGLHAELAEIDENLIRNELHYIDRGTQLQRRKEIYEELYPQTRATAGKELVAKRWDTTTDSVTVSTPSFVADTSNKTGKSQTVIREEIQIAKNIIPQVQEVIREQEVTKADAIKIARLEPKEQIKVAEKLSEGAKSYVDARRMVAKEEVHEVPVITGKYNVIYADPPWKYDFAETSNRAIENQYPTMEVEDIKNTEVPCTDDAVLFLWATAPKLVEAMDVMRAWGFNYKTCAVWDKQIIGMGYWFRGQHELLLVGTKGNFSPPLIEGRESSIYGEQRTKHSKKPSHYYELIERMFPNAQYFEMFSRNKFSEKWQVWGNQCE